MLFNCVPGLVERLVNSPPVTARLRDDCISPAHKQLIHRVIHGFWGWLANRRVPGLYHRCEGIIATWVNTHRTVVT